MNGSHKWSQEKETISADDDEALKNKRKDSENDLAQSGFHVASDSSEDNRTRFLNSMTRKQWEQCDLHVAFDYVEIAAGGVSFHHEYTAHGSGLNAAESCERRVIVTHTLDGNATFNPNRSIGYIYGKYQLSDDPLRLDPNFFPVCSGINRCQWIDDYCHINDTIH